MLQRSTKTVFLCCVATQNGNLVDTEIITGNYSNPINIQIPSGYYIDSQVPTWTLDKNLGTEHIVHVCVDTPTEVPVILPETNQPSTEVQAPTFTTPTARAAQQSAAKLTQLPQTGENEVSSKSALVAGLGLLTSAFGIVLGKKK